MARINPTQEELAAMWLYHNQYAKSGLGAIKFWEWLPECDKTTVRKMIEEITYAGRVVKAKKRGHRAKA